jgi:hypothetical protein
MPIAAYAMAIGAMLFAGVSALTLIHVVSHLDEPDSPPARESAEKKHPELAAV